MTHRELDEELVRRLTELAIQLDGGDEVRDAPLLAEFNQLAKTSIPFSEFQGIYGSEEHVDYVRRVLMHQATAAQSDLSRAQLMEMFAKVLEPSRSEAYLQYVFSTIEKSFGDHQISDLVFWPGDYFGDGDNGRELTPEMMADAVLTRYQQRQSNR